MLAYLSIRRFCWSKSRAALAMLLIASADLCPSRACQVLFC